MISTMQLTPAVDSFCSSCILDGDASHWSYSQTGLRTERHLLPPPPGLSLARLRQIVYHPVQWSVDIVTLLHNEGN